MTSKKYYVYVTREVTQYGKSHWLELRGIRSLVAAQRHVERYLDGLIEPEIAISGNDGNKTVVAKKNKAGKWEAVKANK